MKIPHESFGLQHIAAVALCVIASMSVVICSAQDLPRKAKAKHAITKSEAAGEFTSFIKEREYLDSPYEIASPESERILMSIEKILLSEQATTKNDEWRRNWTKEFIEYLRHGHGEYLVISPDTYIIHSFFLNASLSGIYLVDTFTKQFKQLASGYGIEIVGQGSLADGTGWILCGYGGLKGGEVFAGSILITYYDSGRPIHVESTRLVDESIRYSEETTKEDSDEYWCGTGEARIEAIAGRILGHKWKDVNNDGQDELIFTVEEKDCNKVGAPSVKVQRVFIISRGSVRQAKSGSECLSNASCNKNVESVLDEALRYARPLSSEDSERGFMSEEEVRSDYFYLLPDIAVNYADAGCWAKANNILAQSRGMLRDQLKADLANSRIRNGFADKAEELIRTLDEPETQSDLLVKLAALHIRLGNNEKADNLIAEVEGATQGKFQGGPTAEFVRILVKNGYMDVAEKYAIAGQSAYSSMSLPEVAGGYIKQKQLTKGEALITKALSGCKLSERRCDTTLWLTARAYYFAGRADVAMKYAQRIVSINTRTQTLIEIAKSVSDEAVALKAVEMARAYAGKCKGDDCRYIGGWIAEGYAAAGQAQKALNHLNKCYVKDPIGWSVSLEKTVRQLARRGRVKEARKLMGLQTMDSPSKDGMKQAIAVAELKKGNFESALSIVESIPNSYVQFSADITLAKANPNFSFIKKWLSKTRPDDHYIETYAGSVQVLLAAASRNGNTAEARNYIETLNNSLLKARGLIGIAQGLLGKRPGEEWAQSLELTW